MGIEDAPKATVQPLHPVLNSGKGWEPAILSPEPSDHPSPEVGHYRSRLISGIAVHGGDGSIQERPEFGGEDTPAVLGASRPLVLRRGQTEVLRDPPVQASDRSAGHLHRRIQHPLYRRFGAYGPKGDRPTAPVQIRQRPGTMGVDLQSGEGQG